MVQEKAAAVLKQLYSEVSVHQAIEVIFKDQPKIGVDALIAQAKKLLDASDPLPRSSRPTIGEIFAETTSTGLDVAQRVSRINELSNPIGVDKGRN